MWGFHILLYSPERIWYSFILGKKYEDSQLMVLHENQGSTIKTEQ